MPTLVELATQIVTAQVSSGAMSTDDILASLTRIHNTMGQLEKGSVPAIPVVAAAPFPAPKISVTEAFRKNDVTCLICGEDFKILGTHLSKTHGVKPGDYKKQFGIPKNQPLCSKVVFEHKRQLALERQNSHKDQSPAKPVAEAAEVKRGRGRPKAKKGQIAIQAGDAVVKAQKPIPANIAEVSAARN